MEKTRKYEIDGMELTVPVYRDDFSGKYPEDYSRWFDLDQFTPSGYLILVSAEDACDFAESTDSKKCIDCAVCRHYRRAAPHTLIGYCINEKRKKYYEEYEEREVN